MEPSRLTGSQKTLRLLDFCSQRGGLVSWFRSPESRTEEGLGFLGLGGEEWARGSVWIVGVGGG